METSTSSDSSSSSPAATKHLFDVTHIDRTALIADRDRIAASNPHRDVMALLDGVVWTTPDFSRGMGVKHIRDDEFWVKGHFPGSMGLPGK